MQSSFSQEVNDNTQASATQSFPTPVSDETSTEIVYLLTFITI